MARPRSPNGRARETDTRLEGLFPGTARELCELNHRNAFELLGATILSAQCTDVRVNLVTPALFASYGDADEMSHADLGKVESLIHSTGFYRAKAKNLIAMASALVDNFAGEVPSRLEDLVTLPGVGRKTGNVVRSVAFDLPGLPVDTHVIRLSARLGLSDESDPVRLESALNQVIAPNRRGAFSLRMILLGRRTCKARTPDCRNCPLVDYCPSGSAGRS